MLLGAWFGSLDVIELGTDDGNELRFWYGKPLGTTLGYLYGFPIGTYDVTELGWLEGSTEVTADGDLDGMLLVSWLLSVNVIEIGTKLWALDGLELGAFNGTEQRSLEGFNDWSTYDKIWALPMGLQMVSLRFCC